MYEERDYTPSCERCGNDWNGDHPLCSRCRRQYSSPIIHADRLSDPQETRTACGIDADADTSFFVENIADYKASIHAINRCRRCEQALQK